MTFSQKRRESIAFPGFERSIVMTIREELKLLGVSGTPNISVSYRPPPIS